MPLQNVGELCPLLLPLVQVRQSLQSLGVLSAQIQNPLPPFYGFLDVPQPFRREMGNLGADLRFLHVPHGVLELALVDAVELHPGFLLFVDAPQRLDRVFVGRFEFVEDPPEGADGVIDLLQLFFVYPSQPRVQLDLLHRVLGGLCALLENPSELRRLPERGVDAIEVGKCIGLPRSHGQHIAVGLLRFRRIRQLLLEHARQSLPDDGLDASLHPFEAEHIGVAVGQLLPPLVDHGCEPLDLLASTLLERALLHRSDVDVECHHRIAESLFRVLGYALVQNDALIRVLGVRELGFPNANQFLPLTHGLVERIENLAHFQLLRAGFKQPLQRLQGLDVLRRGVDDLAVGSNGLAKRPQLNLVHLPQSVLELEDFFWALADLRLTSQDFCQVRPSLRLREEPVQRLQCVLILRIGVQHSSISRYGAIEILQLGFVDLRHA